MIFFRILGFLSLINIVNSFVSLKPSFIKPTKLIQKIEKKQIEKQKIRDIQEKIADPPNKFPISGFYGLIGPKIDYKNVSSLFDLFTGDGIIQGIFLENGTATFTQSLVNTEKRQFENNGYSYKKHIFITVLHMILNYLRIIPNMLGVANTAFLKVSNIDTTKTYALFERDMPYEIRIDSLEKKINTIGKHTVPGLHTFSGHSKVINGNIETIEYNILNNQVIWYQLDSDFKKLNKIYIQMKYMPMVHDFYSDEKYILLIDSPIKIDLPNILFEKIPLRFDKSEPTFIYLIEKTSGKIETFKTDRSLYIFHYSDVKIKENTINILSPFYDNIDYNKVLHHGKYRRLRIDRTTGSVQLFKYRELEPLNLDFPIILWKGSVKQYILRNIEDGRINGFYILEKTDIVKKIIFEEYFICGEPGVFYLERETNNNNTNRNNNNTRQPVLVCFGIHELTKMQYFIMVNLETDEQIKYPISYPLFIGFHSIIL
jgi:hypothetical protein